MLDLFFMLEPDIPAGLGVAHFSPIHLAWLICVFALVAGLALAFSRMSMPARRRVLCVLAASLLLLELVRDLWLWSIGRFDPQYTLPLHLCGMMLFVEAAAVFFPHPLWRELSYALGMPAAFFAMLTPESTAYPLFNFYYLTFIASHALLFTVPILLLIDGFRPDARRLPACAGALTLAGVVGVVANSLLDSNYLFLNQAPAGSLLEPFATLPHSLYLLCIAGLLIPVWSILYLPWSRQSTVSQ